MSGRKPKFCTKIPHKTEKDARAHMLRALRNNGGKKYGKVRVYQCDVCGHWHFGHMNDISKDKRYRANMVAKETVHG
jgi:rubrerythrin